ncbi:MAG: L-fucokinase [Oscillospiraceae bacterium]
MHNLISLFLKQSDQDNWADYTKSLHTAGFPKWDYVILTASNDAQAKAYRMQIDYRLTHGMLPKGVHYAVVSDPEGKRVGSGGATLNVLRYIRKTEGAADCFDGKRFLVIHSGGDSRRVPQYSACGKLFSPVPRMLPNGRRSTLFDEFIIGLSGVPARIAEGMLVMSGDVLLLFNPLQIDFLNRGAAAISIKADVETGKNHGVFLPDGQMNVRAFLHKQTPESLARCGAVNARGKVNIDTGAVILSAEVVNRLFGLIATDGDTDPARFDAFVNETARISFYADFLYPLASESTLEQYYRETPEGDFSEALTACRTQIWAALHGCAMQLIALSPAEFIHFGTTAELLRLVTEQVGRYDNLGWTNAVNSNAAAASFACSNAYIQSGAEIGAGSYIEDSFVRSAGRVGTGAILSGVTLGSQTVPDGAVVHCLKQNDGRFVVRIYGTDDNPKAELADARLFGIPLTEILEKNAIPLSAVWDNGARTLWTARLYKSCATIAQSLDFALELYRLATGGGDARAFLEAERTSLFESFNNADVSEVLPWQIKVNRTVQAFRFIDAVRAGLGTDAIRRLFAGGVISAKKADIVAGAADKFDFCTKIRIYHNLSKIAAEPLRERFGELCFAEIRDRMFEETIRTIGMPARRAMRRDEAEVRLPVRVNFGGGWSDTPPYCIENGGTVLNAAITLGGQLPVKAQLRRLNRPVFALASTDSGAYREFDRLDALCDCRNPYDPFALHKAALFACGILPTDGCGALSDIIAELGGGLYLSTEVTDIPRGSGLGTSSILAGACVKGIYEFFGMELTEKELFTRVLIMEQLMSTGGGWQDQIGGLTAGVKFITTTPGLVQEIRYSTLAIPENAQAELGERFSLIYTGQRRLARNLLREIIGNYLGGNADTVGALAEIQNIAALMRVALERGDIDHFAQLMNAHWAQSKKLDAGCTNTCIEQIFLSVESMIDGRMICGAGGGGFLQVVRKKGVTAEDLRDRLTGVFQDSGVDVWGVEF